MASVPLIPSGQHATLSASAQVPVGILTVTIDVAGDGIAGRGFTGTLDISSEGSSWTLAVAAFRVVLGLSTKTGTATGATHVIALPNIGWVRVNVASLTIASPIYSVVADVN